jgi:hypothetical protein
MIKPATLPSNNEAWGFFGTIRHHADPADAWPIAMQAIGEATGCSDVGVRDFLDSRTSRETGIPRGLPYLIGFVTDCEIMAEAAA